MNIIEICSIAQEFKDTASKLAKKALLEKYKEHEDFKQYIKYVLDPLATYGLQDKKISKFLKEGYTAIPDGEGFNLFNLFAYLEDNGTGSDKDAKLVAGFINKQPTEELRKFVLESVTKKVRLGMSEKTVNEIWGKGFLNQFNVMLAKKFDDEMHKIEEGTEFVLTEKYDGQRAAAIKKDNAVRIYSREGIRIKGLVDIEKDIMKLSDGVYDGELLCANHEELKDRDVLQQTLKLTRKDGEKHGVVFFMFDAIPLDEFDNGISERTYVERRAKLGTDLLDVELEYTSLIPILYLGTDLSVIPDLLSELESKGKEGLMLNFAHAPYECKRSGNILKLKTMQTCDLKIIGFEAGKPMGKFEHTLGKFVVDYKGYPLGVSGISDEVRDKVWNNQEAYLGKIIEVSYFRESKNEAGGLSVSFPQFKGFREDKTEPSYY